MKKSMLVIVSCFIAVIVCSNSLFTDCLRVKYGFARMNMASASEVVADIDEDKIAETLNIGMANAAPTSVTTYIKDLKMASHPTSASSAKYALSSQNYTVIDHNMNEGTGEGYVYLGYKTTIDKKDAITDISIMDMKGGYRVVDYSLIGKEKEDNINDIIVEMRSMLNEYRENYYQGSIGAILAFEGLNKVVYNDKYGTSTKLGTYLLDYVKNDQASDDFLRDMMLKGNSSIVAGVYNYLTFAVQNVTYTKNKDGGILPVQENNTSGKPTPAKTWLDEIEKEDLSREWEKYESKALALVPIIEEFAKSYIRAKQLFDENNEKFPESKKTEKQIMDDFKSSNMQDALKDDTTSVYLMTYDILDSYAYGDGKLSDSFVQLDDEGSVAISPESIYPLVKALTEGQYAAMHSGNLIALINNAVLIKGEVGSKTDGYKNAMEEIDKINLTNDENKAVDLYHGVNLEAYEGKVGITDAAFRQMNAENNYDAITKGTVEKDDIVEKVNLWVGVATSAVILVTSSFPLINLVAGIFPTLFSKFAVTTAIAGFAKLAAASTVVSILNWLSLGLIVIIVIYYLVEWLHSLYEYYHPKYTPIPGAIFDIVGTSYLPYTAVGDLNKNNKPGDLNNFQGKEWNAMYTTKDPKAGPPLVLKPNVGASDAVFNVKLGDSANPSNSVYEPVTRFGERTAYNLNAHAYDDDVYGIFLFYLVDGKTSADKLEPIGKYLARVLLRSEKTEEAAKWYLEDKGFKVFDVNLSLGVPGLATYIGYQTTNISTQALTDFRIAYGTNQAQIMFGESSYGACGYSGLDVGKNEKGDNPIDAADYTLYATVDKNRGSPIYSQLQYRTQLNSSYLGDEPINLFSGGGSFNFRSTSIAINSSLKSLKPAYVYFTPSVKYVSGDRYLGGIYFLHNEIDTNSSLNDILAREDFNDKFEGVELNYKFYYREAAKDYYRKFFMYYTRTYNPKRAIADMMIFEPKSVDSQITLPDNIQNQGINYVAAEVITRTSSMFVGKYVTSSNIIKRGNGLYLAPGSSKHAPLNSNDVYFSNSPTTMSDYRSVSRVGDYYNTDVVSLNRGEIYAKSPLYIYIKRDKPIKPKYISALQPSYSMVSYYATDWARLNAMSAGSENFADANFNAEEDSDRIGLLGLSYTNTKTKAVRDIALYYVMGTPPTASDAADKITHTVPPKTIKTNGIDYQRASTNAIYAGRGYYVYFYITYSGLVGEPIVRLALSNVPIQHTSYRGDVLETAKVLSTGVDSIHGFYFLKLMRSGKDPYISNLKAITGFSMSNITIYNKATYNWFGEAYVDEEAYYKYLIQQSGVSFFIDQNINANTKRYNEFLRDNSPLYLGFNRTSSRAAAITGIIARTPSMRDGEYGDSWWRTYNDMSSYKQYVLNDIVYTKLGAVNVNGYYVYLYTTTDPRAGSPITRLYVNNSSKTIPGNNTVKFTLDSENTSYDRKANLNLGAKPLTSGGNELYLHYERLDGSVEKGDNSALASVFSDSTTIIIICLAIILSSGSTCLIIYGRNNKKKNLIKK